MAHTEHLPIYKRAYDLRLDSEQVVQGYSRYRKYTLGSDLRDGARQSASSGISFGWDRGQADQGRCGDTGLASRGTDYNSTPDSS